MLTNEQRDCIKSAAHDVASDLRKQGYGPESLAVEIVSASGWNTGQTRDLLFEYGCTDTMAHPTDIRLAYVAALMREVAQDGAYWLADTDGRLNMAAAE